jgi:nitroimidazol reductase NimA-like FMN-containing flavoprotein (pyridoxamine 5'-phosphate oxidase superfamily)
MAMRRSERAMSEADALALLIKEQVGVLSTASADGAPYGVPLNYCFVREDNAIFFHCALKGRKIDDIRSNPHVSFTVVGRNRIIPERLTTYYESVIVSGRASFVDDEEEKERRFDQLCGHLTPDVEWRVDGGCKFLKAVAVVRIDIEGISGKKNGDA